MFSVTYTGMNFFPLCTAMVCPTISGMTVERRDQVRSTFFSFREFMASMRDARKPSTNGPFLVERAINLFPAFRLILGFPACAFRAEQSAILSRLYLLRRLTMKLSVRLLLRVLYPRVGCPQGVTG